jgi:hypothetical protein
MDGRCVVNGLVVVAVDISYCEEQTISQIAALLGASWASSTGVEASSSVPWMRPLPRKLRVVGVLSGPGLFSLSRGSDEFLEAQAKKKAWEATVQWCKTVSSKEKKSCGENREEGRSGVGCIVVLVCAMVQSGVAQLPHRVGRSLMWCAGRPKK